MIAKRLQTLSLTAYKIHRVVQRNVINSTSALPCLRSCIRKDCLRPIQSYSVNSTTRRWTETSPGTCFQLQSVSSDHTETKPLLRGMLWSRLRGGQRSTWGSGGVRASSRTGCTGHEGQTPGSVTLALRQPSLLSILLPENMWERRQSGQVMLSAAAERTVGAIENNPLGVLRRIPLGHGLI